MDMRRLNTEEVLRAGILNITPTESKTPEYVEFYQMPYCDDDNPLSLEDIERLLRENLGIESAQYYGCWKIWKDDDGFHGELMQYRRMTEDFHGESLDYAADKAYTWFTSLD